MKGNCSERIDNGFFADHIMTDDMLKSPYPQRELTEEEKHELFAKRMENSIFVLAQCSNCKFYSVVNQTISCLKDVFTDDKFGNREVCTEKISRGKR